MSEKAVIEPKLKPAPVPEDPEVKIKREQEEFLKKFKGPTIIDPYMRSEEMCVKSDNECHERGLKEISLVKE